MTDKQRRQMSRFGRNTRIIDPTKERGDPDRVSRLQKPKRKVPKSRLGGKLKQRLRKLLRNRRKTARKGKRAGRRQRRTGVGEGIAGHMAIIDGKNWDGSRNNPRANARRERQRTRKAKRTLR
jgi:hypothetical protein